MNKEISAVLKNNMDHLNSELNTDKNFDIIYRTLKIADFILSTVLSRMTSWKKCWNFSMG